MLFLWAFQIVAAANTPNLCSNQLTAQGGSNYNIWNSYGSCSSQCEGYAFAIAQGNECWCSNEAPGDTVDSSECSEPCPGFPDDICGGTGGQYGYFQIGQPSGTQGGSSYASSTERQSTSTSVSSSTPSTSSTSSPSSSSSSSTSSTQSQTSSTESTSSSSSDSTSSSTAESSSSTLSTSRTTSGPPSSEKPSSITADRTVSYVTITQSNSVQTITQRVSPTNALSSTESASLSAESASSTAKNGFFQKKGAVAGVFVVVGLLVLALALLALLLCIRRRRNTHTITAASSNMSHSGRNSFAQLENDSQLVPIFDQRVDAQQMYMRWENNVSQQSLQDNQDYSRKVLRVANPDND